MKYKIYNIDDRICVTDIVYKSNENKIEYFIDPSGKIRKFFHTIDGKIIEDNLINSYIVCRSTDTVDRSNKEIYENDIVEVRDRISRYIPVCVVKWSGIKFHLIDIFNRSVQSFSEYIDLKILGNIINPPCNFSNDHRCHVCDGYLNDCKPVSYLK